MKQMLTIYKFYKLVFDRRDTNLECFNPATQWQTFPVRYRTREKAILVLAMSNNQTQKEMNVSLLSQKGGDKVVFYSAG